MFTLAFWSMPSEQKWPSLLALGEQLSKQQSSSLSVQQDPASQHLCVRIQDKSDYAKGNVCYKLVGRGKGFPSAHRSTGTLTDDMNEIHLICNLKGFILTETALNRPSECLPVVSNFSLT